MKIRQIIKVNYCKSKMENQSLINQSYHSLVVTFKREESVTPKKYFLKERFHLIGLLILTILLTFWDNAYCQIQEDVSKNVLSITRQRASIYEDCGRNAVRLLKGWIDLKQDPETKLFSKGGVWNYHDEAADHYSSLVLVAYYTNPGMIEGNGILHQTLVNSQDLCSTSSGIPTLYNLGSKSKGEEAQLGHLAEWLRDGLIRIVEVMGVNNDWYKEMERLTDAILIEVDKRGGINKVFYNLGDKGEDCGNMLQTLARLYAISGKERYLKAAESLADALLANIKAIQKIVNTGKYGIFLDHGSELIPGLGELFALECQIGSPKAKEYEKPLRELLDGILKSNAHPSTGLFCTYVESEEGSKKWNHPPDTWGYLLFAYENFDRGTGEERYKKAIEKPMKWLIENRYNFELVKLQGTLWPYVHWGSDDWSDSYESMIDLWNKYPSVDGVFEWLDWSTLRYHRFNFNGMKEYGPYTGHHFDGSLGRTLCSHMMICSQGVRTVPFIEGLRLGGIQEDGTLYLSLESDKEWKGKLYFDSPRTEYKTATLNWARINMMPQWFIARPGKKYSINVFGSKPEVVDGQELINGIEMRIFQGQIKPVQVTPLEE